ncbi:MAG TPA: amino acid permease [Chlamydiales bacterium]|nr:amino acid permease [Chlamydiales bacterium]
MNHAANRVVQLARKNLKRVVGAKELFAVGYGDVGSSIYYTLGATALYALGATPIALMIAGCVFICTALTYAELSTTFPESGGSATYAKHAFNDLISFIAGWGLLLDYLLTLAISAFTIPPYLKHIFGLFGKEAYITGPMHTVSVIIIIVGLFIINLIGIRSSGRFSLILAVFTLVTQVGIVLMGALLVLNLPYVIEHIRIGIANEAWSPSWWQFWQGTAMAMVAYTGIEAVSQMASETKRPTISIPKAIKWTITTVIFLYIGLASVGLSIVSPHELGTKYLEDAVGGIAMNFPVGGRVLGPWVGVTAAIILMICANAGLIGCSRLIFSLGSNYQVPKIFARLHSRFRTPYIALAIFSLIAIGIIIWSKNQMLVLADLYNFGAQIAFFFAHLSLLTLRVKRPTLERPFKAPLNIPLGKGRSVPLTAVFGMLASFSVWLLVIITKPDGRIAGLVWMLIGIIIYALYRKKSKLNIVGTLKVEEIRIPEHKNFVVKHMLVIARSKGGTEGLQTAFQIAKYHHAKITVAYILEIPESVLFDAEIKDQEHLGEIVLKKAEALAREYNCQVNLELVRTRAVDQALIQLVRGHSFELAVIPTVKNDFTKQTGLIFRLERFLEKAPCKVIFYNM